MLFIIGMTRGGNTWLGKIFDAHPDVFFRHEPDSILKTDAFPHFCSNEDVPLHLSAAKDYFERVFRVRTSKAVGTFPVMPKSYYSSARFQLKRALVVGAKGFEKIGVFSKFFRNVPIPDLADVEAKPVHHVVKSINALGRMNIFRRLYPDTKIILLLRHPGGQIHSTIKAVEEDKMDGQPPDSEDWGIYEDLAGTDQARREQLTLSRFKSMDPVERLAWRWSISNDKAIEDLGDSRQLRIVVYEDLCADPISVSRSLFEFAGISWRPEVERFATASSTASNANAYDRVIRDSLKTAHSWRQKLEPRQVQMIADVLQRSRAGQYYLGREAARPNKVEVGTSQRTAAN